MMTNIRGVVKRIPYTQLALQRIRALTGHFDSPIPSVKALKRREGQIWSEPSCTLEGIDLCEDAQLAMLETLAQYAADLHFEAQKKEPFRFFYENGFFGYSDGFLLACILRYLRPKKLIEVGSGFSSGLIFDTNDLFLDYTLDCTFIDPYPQRLFSLMTERDQRQAKVLQKPVQEVDVEVFEQLAAGDILFIDSSHVCKTDSDVNYLYFKVLPRLHAGVYVHIHDIPYPFEYPKHWVLKGRAWNEAYLLRAFLQYNNAFEIVIHSHFLYLFHLDRLKELMPLCTKGDAGSIWLRKVTDGS
ncbi:MAG: class I SAM-dependent methyltransferase [Ktedonobacteraceae bacterium]